MIGSASRAGDSICGDGETFIGRGDAVCLKFLFSGFAHPIGGPGGADRLFDADGRVSGRCQFHSDLRGDHVHGRTAGVRRRDGDDHFLVLDLDVANDSQIEKREHGNLRVGDATQDLVDGMGSVDHGVGLPFAARVAALQVL